MRHFHFQWVSLGGLTKIHMPPWANHFVSTGIASTMLLGVVGDSCGEQGSMFF